MSHASGAPNSEAALFAPEDWYGDEEDNGVGYTFLIRAKATNHGDYAVWTVRIDGTNMGAVVIQGQLTEISSSGKQVFTPNEFAPPVYYHAIYTDDSTLPAGLIWFDNVGIYFAINPGFSFINTNMYFFTIPFTYFTDS